MQKPIPGFPGYEITDDGRVWSNRRKGSKGLWLRPGRGSHGYLAVMLSCGGVRSVCCIHRLVLETFVGPCPLGMEACHGNDNKSDNRIDNLRWDTHAANGKDAVRNETGVGRTKLTAQQVRWIVYTHGTGLFTQTEIGEQYGVDRMTVNRIINHRTWKSLWT